MAPLTTEVKAKDGAAFVAYLDTLPQVNKKAPIGVSGYCMGGPYTMLTAAAVPDRVGAAGSFHGGNLVTDKADSPHLLAPKIKAAYYFAIATNDDQRQPDAKLANGIHGLGRSRPLVQEHTLGDLEHQHIRRQLVSGEDFRYGGGKARILEIDR